jgi:hypothetical protein
MALGILAEAVLRIEHKLDLVLKRLGFLDATPHPQMHFVGHMCPVCNQAVDYQIDITHNVAVRKCGCKTGKQPSTIPLTPVTGAQNGNTPPASSATPSPDGREAENASNRHRR